MSRDYAGAVSAKEKFTRTSTTFGCQLYLAAMVSLATYIMFSCATNSIRGEVKPASLFAIVVFVAMFLPSIQDLVLGAKPSTPKKQGSFTNQPVRTTDDIESSFSSRTHSTEVELTTEQFNAKHMPYNYVDRYNPLIKYDPFVTMNPIAKYTTGSSGNSSTFSLFN